MLDVVRSDRPSRISKTAASSVTPHLADREAICGSFRWSEARRQLDGMPGGALNIAAEAVDRHARGFAGVGLCVLRLSDAAKRSGL